MNRKKALALAIILSMTTTSLFSFANTEAELNKKLEENKKNQNNLNIELQQTKKQENAVLQKIKEIEAEINKSEVEIENLQNKISTTEKEITKTLNNLETAENNIEGKQDIMGDRINVMYKNGTVGYVEVLLNSKDFTDLLTNLDMIKRIMDHDVSLLKELKEQREIIEKEKISLENKKRQLVNLKSNVENEKKTLVVSRGRQERLRTELSQDKVALEEMMAQNQRVADKLVNELRSLQSDSEYVGGVLQWPVPGHTRISSPFGNRIHPILNVQKFHSGIDIPAPSGRPVVAAGSGTVVSSSYLGSYGNAVIIDHGGGIMTLYAHNSRLLVSNGDKVSKGQNVALIGSTGGSTGPHLHFEVRKNGKYMNPISYVK